MWVAGYGAGIFKFNPQQNKFVKYQPGLGEGKEELIWGIYVNPNSNGQIVWLTSAGGGLLKFNRIENFARFIIFLSRSPQFYRSSNLTINTGIATPLGWNIINTQTTTQSP